MPSFQNDFGTKGTFSRLRSLIKRNHGQAIVEFAIMLPIAALIVYATLEVARVYVVQRHMVTAASIGARTGTLRTSDTADVQNAIATYLSSTEVGTNYAANIAGVGPTATSNTMVTVSLTTNLQLFTAFDIPGVTVLPLTSTVTMRHQ